MNKEFYNKLAEEAKASDTLKEVVETQSIGQLFIKNLLLKKAAAQKLVATEKEFDAFQQAQEELAEKISTGEIVLTAEEKQENQFYGMKLVDRAKAHNPLDDEIIPANIEPHFTSDDLVTIYEEPEKDEEPEETEEEVAAEIQAETSEKERLGKQESFALSVVLNDKQMIAGEFADQGKSFCLIGAAGTGKTTATRNIAEKLLLNDQLNVSTFKSYDQEGKREYKSAPSIAFCAFTRRAAANLQKAIFKSPLLEKRLRHNIMTIHTLLEYEPETYFDPIENKEKFRFAPQRTAQNPLTITHLIIEEASMLDAMTLWKNLYEALPPGVQIIFIGDINQLPPVFGPSILNYALVQLPIVELTEVYRNQGVILENAHNILKGEKLKEDENFVIVRGKSPTQVGQNKLSHTLGALFNAWLDIKGSDGLPEYDPEDCMILSPWNKQECGTDNMNAWIAQHLGSRRNAIVHEVIAGFSKLYLAVGDRIMFNKLDGVIIDIYRNPNYHGKEPQFAGSDLTRFGVRVLGTGSRAELDLDEAAVDYSNFSLEALEAEKAERKQQASHTVVVKLDNGKVEELSAAGDFSAQVFSLGYCLTVHKAQGCEWKKVFILLHKDHAVSLFRELFYTAVTRAREQVVIIAKDDVLNKAIKNQRIKGNSLADKIEYFNSGALDMGVVSCVK